MNVTDDQARMLGELGYKPGWMKDVRDGDSVMIPRSMGEEIEEWTVDGLWNSDRSGGGYIRHFVGTAPDGTAKPHAFSYEYPLYIKRDEP